MLSIIYFTFLIFGIFHFRDFIFFGLSPHDDFFSRVFTDFNSFYMTLVREKTLPSYLPYVDGGFPSDLVIESKLLSLIHILLFFVDGVGLTIYEALLAELFFIYLGTIALFRILRGYNISLLISWITSVIFLTNPFWFNMMPFRGFGAYFIPIVIYFFLFFKINTFRNFIISLLVFFQFFVISYPGLIIAFLFAGLLSFFSMRRSLSLHFLSFSLAGIFSVLHYFPSFYAGLRGKTSNGFSSLMYNSDSLILLFYPNSYLDQNDGGLRSLYIFASLLICIPAWILFYKSITLRIYYKLVFFSLIFGFGIIFGNWQSNIPVLNFSRWREIEYGILINFSLLILFAFFLEKTISTRKFILTISAGNLIVIFLVILARNNLHSRDDYFGYLLISLVISNILLLFLHFRRKITPLNVVLTLLLSLTISIFNLNFAHYQKHWQHNRVELEVHTFGNETNLIFEKTLNLSDYKFRPQRQTFSNDILSDSDITNFNLGRSALELSFTLGGDSASQGRAYQISNDLYEILLDPKCTSLINFLNLESIFVNADKVIKSHKDCGDFSVQILSMYDSSKYDFWNYTSNTLLFGGRNIIPNRNYTLNELNWPGWRLKACDTKICENVMLGEGFLINFNVNKNYTYFSLHYEPNKLFNFPFYILILLLSFLLFNFLIRLYKNQLFK
jgi:hypothetical protein